MTLRIKDNTVFRQFVLTRKFELQGYFVDKGSGSGIFPDPDPSDPKKTGSATLLKKLFMHRY